MRKRLSPDQAAMKIAKKLKKKKSFTRQKLAELTGRQKIKNEYVNALAFELEKHRISLFSSEYVRRSNGVYSALSFVVEK